MGKPSRQKDKQTTPQEPLPLGSDTDLYQPGDYVTLKCQKYKEFVPQIGKVVAINEATVKVQWLEGEYDEEFKFWKGRRGKIITEDFPKRAVIGRINLTASMKLTDKDISNLKDLYDKAEFV